MKKQGLTIYQDPISLAFEVYYKGERLPIRVISIRERNDLGDIEFTIETAKGYPTVFTDNRPMECEDYEEPKEYCYITSRGNFHFIEDIDDEGDKERKEIGNYFETKEEAEKAVEKLKAWKRLEDKGFEFNGFELIEGKIRFVIDLRELEESDLYKDLILLFGKE